MIVIYNFKEAHQLHQQGVIPFRLVQDQARVLTDICPQPGRYIDEAIDVSDSDIEWLLRQPDVSEEDYNGMLGGEVYVCQTEEDLKQIVGMDMEFARTHGGRWPDCTDQVMSWDQCRYLEQQDQETEWALFLLCWNDAGGPVYYVPKHLWKAARMAEHIEETNQHWG